MNNIVRIWIGNPYEGGNFNGTAFFIDEQTLVTAKHVITDRDGKTYNNVFISNTPDGGITPIENIQLCEKDLAVLKVKKTFNIENIVFTNEIVEGSDVNVIGFYDKDSSQKTYKNRVSGYQNSTHVYELQNHLTNGLSGSPVLLDNKICGVATAINSKKNLTYLIPISELCMDVSYFDKKKIIDDIPEKKKLTLEQMGIIASIVGVVVSVIVILLPNNDNKPSGDTFSGNNGPIINVKPNITGGNNTKMKTVINHNPRISQKECIDSIDIKERRIRSLTRELNNSTMPENRKNIKFDLESAYIELKKLKQESCQGY